MKPWLVLVIIMVLAPLLTFGRPIDIKDSARLITDASLVFVGRVKSIKPSEIRTTLSYPAWNSVVFQWRIVGVEVLEPFKGARKGDVVQTAMLSYDEQTPALPFVNPPLMLNPRVDDIYLLCLGPRPRTNLFAALSAPWDEKLSIFRLYRNPAARDAKPKFTNLKPPFSDMMWPDSGPFFLLKDERFSLVWGLVNEAGEIQPANVEGFRERYAAEARMAPKIVPIHLEWETYTNASGWQSDVPKGYLTNGTVLNTNSTSAPSPK